MLLNALIAAACCAVTAFVVLPSLADDEVYNNVAAALRHTGHSLSGYTLRNCLSHRSQPQRSTFTHGVAMCGVAGNFARLGHHLLLRALLHCLVGHPLHWGCHCSSVLFRATGLLVQVQSHINLLLQSLQNASSPWMAKAGLPSTHYIHITDLHPPNTDWCCRHSSLMCSTRTADSGAHGATANKLQAGTAEPEAATSKSAGTDPKAEGNYSTVQQKLAVRDDSSCLLMLHTIIACSAV